MLKGFCIGYIIATTIACAIIYSLKNAPIRSSKKIIPEIELITDGKVVDTLFIYKKE